MGLEAAIEQGLKTALQAYTNGLDPADAVTYRCFFLDDESESGAATEARAYPLIEITASPNVPTKHKSTFRDTPVEIKWATHKNTDPKKATLRGLYENCRTIIDTETTITFTEYSRIAVRIESGGESGVEENEQYITLPLTVKVCGA